jgi:hypothetical protein
VLPLHQQFRDGLGRLLTHGPTLSEATDLQGRYRPFQVNVNERRGKTYANPAPGLQGSRKQNEPICRDFPHLQVEARFSLQRPAKENKVAKKKELKKAKKIQPTKTLCCSGTH